MPNRLDHEMAAIERVFDWRVQMFAPEHINLAAGLLVLLIVLTGIIASVWTVWLRYKEHEHSIDIREAEALLDEAHRHGAL